MKFNRKSFLLIINVFFLSIFASQCFAQSYTDSADSDKQMQKRYAAAITQVFSYIQNNYIDEIDPKVLYEGAMKGMLDSLGDTYSCYLDQSQWRNLTDTTVGSFGGVGLSITKANVSTPEKPAYVEVASPIDDSPGAKAGIQSGDLIIKIEGTDTSTITMDEVLGMLRGPVGESVRVTIRRGKNKLEFEKVLVRAVIENPTIKYGVIDSIGYVRVSEFGANTAMRFQEALDSFNSSAVKGIIIDLRNNGGGLLSSAVEIADKFIDYGPIVSTKSRISYENQVYTANPHKTVVKNMPVIVLINRGTASASEILSGALKDTKKAYLVGENSFGKGSVQIPSGLVNQDGFKITVARYYSPTDINIDKVGIKPDLEIKYPELTEEQGNDWIALEESSEISDYVEDHPNMTEEQISAYAVVLGKKYSLEQRFLRKMIRNAVDRAKPSRLYDLDYDLQLKEALRLLNEENFENLMSTTKTLGE